MLVALNHLEEKNSFTKLVPNLDNILSSAGFMIYLI